MYRRFFLAIILLSSSSYALADIDIGKMYASMVEQWRVEIKTAFDTAEKNVFNVVPTPDEVVGPHEDPAKCVCKGSGTIVHGDGHTTPCPFHSREPEPEAEPEIETIADPPLVKIKKTTCRCETRCACDDCQCAKGEVELLLRKTEIK